MQCVWWLRGAAAGVASLVFAAGLAMADNEVIDTGTGSVFERGADLLRSTKVRPRFFFGSRGMIEGDFGDADVSWVRSNGAMSVAVPLTDKFSIVPRISGQSVNWSFDGDNRFLDTGKTSGRPFDDLIQLGFRVDGRYKVTERWSAVGSVSLATSIEDGADLDDGARWGGSLGAAYERETYRVMLGVGLREKMIRNSISVAPIFYGMWRPYDWLRLETEGLGLRATARVAKGWRLFTFGGVSSERYRLDDRNDGPNGVRAGTLRDRRVRAGVGAQWRASETFRFEFDTGAIAWQQLRVNTQDNDEFDTETMDDPAAFLSLRLQVRF